MATKYFVAPVVALQCYALATPRRSKLEYSMRGNIEAFVDEINKFTRIKRSFYLHLIYLLFSKSVIKSKFNMIAELIIPL